jgi:hypothetical protein
MQVVNDAPETKAWGKPPTNSNSGGQEGKQQDGHKLDRQQEVGLRGDHMKKKKKQTSNKKKGESKADNDKSRKEKENTDTNKAKLERKDASEKHVGEGERQHDLEPPKKPAWKKDVNSAKVWYSFRTLYFVGVGRIQSG